MVLGLSSDRTRQVDDGMRVPATSISTLANATRVPRMLGVSYANHTEALVWVDRPARGARAGARGHRAGE